MLIQDVSSDHMLNRTLIIGNAGRTSGLGEIDDWEVLSAGRSWVAQKDADQFEQIRVIGHAHLATHPQLQW